MIRTAKRDVSYELNGVHMDHAFDSTGAKWSGDGSHICFDSQVVTREPSGFSPVLKHFAHYPKPQIILALQHKQYDHLISSLFHL
jgi:hypothetical protein